MSGYEYTTLTPQKDINIVKLLWWKTSTGFGQGQLVKILQNPHIFEYAC